MHNNHVIKQICIWSVRSRNFFIKSDRNMWLRVHVTDLSLTWTSRDRRFSTHNHVTVLGNGGGRVQTFFLGCLETWTEQAKNGCQQDVPPLSAGSIQSLYVLQSSYIHFICSVCLYHVVSMPHCRVLQLFFAANQSNKCHKPQAATWQPFQPRTRRR